MAMPALPVLPESTSADEPRMRLVPVPRPQLEAAAFSSAVEAPVDWAAVRRARR